MCLLHAQCQLRLAGVSRLKWTSIQVIDACVAMVNTLHIIQSYRGTPVDSYETQSSTMQKKNSTSEPKKERSHDQKN